MNRTVAFLALVTLSMIILLPALSTGSMVSAQGSGYTVQNVNHDVEIMFSGQVVVRDTFTVSGDLSNGFLVGFPAKYGPNVLKVIAYDDTHIFPVTLAATLGSQDEFYAARVSFDGANPKTFTVSFIFSNQLVYGYLVVWGTDFPAYPSLTVSAAHCAVTFSPPAQVASITISKGDGDVNGTSYSRDNLPALTNAPANASYTIPARLLQPSNITSLQSQVIISPAGILSRSDNYRITNAASFVNATLASFLLSVPTGATGIVVKDEFGKTLASETSGIIGSTTIVNATLSSILHPGQTTQIKADYNLPTGASFYNLNLTIFPTFNYYVDQATFKFTVPAGATIISPQNSSLDSSSRIITGNYQDMLTVNRQGVSYEDTVTPITNSIAVNYNYSPLWASFTPTIWALILSAIGCVGVAFWRRRPTFEKIPVKKEIEKPVEEKEALPVQKMKAGPVTEAQTTKDSVENFVEEYEHRRDIASQMQSLDEKAQKSKLPRSQYRNQRRNLEVKYASLTRNIDKAKATLHSYSGYGDLIKQFENAESNLAQAQRNVRTLESKRSTGEISIEEYKQKIGDYKHEKDKADSAIDGILQKIRGKNQY